MPAVATPRLGPAAFARIYRIHQCLASGRPINAETLARELEMSPRTIKRDVAHMMDRLGCEIAWNAATRSYYYTSPCESLPLLRLTADELTAVALAGKTFAA